MYKITPRRRKSRKSHPAWGEWIEMPTTGKLEVWARAHPAWGEWIEIQADGLKPGRGIVPLRMDSRNIALLLHL